jgi:hypothetical protein
MDINSKQETDTESVSTVSSEDEEEIEHDIHTIWLEGEDECLPVLLNSTSRRKKTIDNYIAPEHLRKSIYRCKEFPGGVYINRYGEICPEDRRSGIYKRRVHAEKLEGSDGSQAEDSEFSQAEEVYVPDDVETDESYVDDVEDEEDNQTDDNEGWEDEINDELNHKQKYKPEDDLESDDEGIVHTAKKSKTHSEGQSWLKNLNPQERQGVFLQELQQAADDSEVYYSRYEASKRRNLHLSKLLYDTNKLTEDWLKLKKGLGYKMEFDAKLLIDEPEFTMIFTKNTKPDALITVKYDCINLKVVCQCHHICKTMSSLIEHFHANHE